LQRREPSHFVKRIVMTANDVGAAKSILTTLGRTTLLVRDQDEALAFYRDRLGFEVLHDGRTPDGFRALHIGLLAQQHEPRVGLWLIPARGNEELALVGRQTDVRRCLWFTPAIAGARRQRLAIAA
jgi:catechol 2,3-dioxygenase-like lactoylglutathione lyase family enzyme